MRYLSLLITPVLLLSNQLIVNIDNVKTTKGSLFIGLYKDKENFTNINSVYQSDILEVVDNQDFKTTFHIPNGTYAISVFHDENGNKELDTNFFGIPKEGFGFSNNPKIGFSKPTFEECSFKIEQNKQINITLGY
jgi:uncharacterized protein (DUF2141 family)